MSAMYCLLLYGVALIFCWTVYQGETSEAGGGGKSQQLVVQSAVILCKGERLNSLLVVGASLLRKS